MVEFNGTVVLDWNNVTIPQDRDVAWHPLHPTLMERGYVYVAVAAQRLGVEFSPLALKQWDPVRYGDLHHPGDDYSWDIFSQAAEAVLDPIVLRDLRPGIERRLAMGASQSAGRLTTYINEVHEEAEVFDGFQPQLSGGVDNVRRDLAPVLWINSGGEVGDSHREADGDLLRLWEIAGSAHTSYGSTAYNNLGVTLYAHSNGVLGDYDEEDGGAWGYQREPDECLTDNYMVVGHAWSAALVTLDDWVRTGRAPEPMPRVERDEEGRVYDEHGNLAGGVRLPMLEVPIATYAGGGIPPGEDPCMEAGGRMALRGFTRIFDEATLAELYPSQGHFLEQFDAAVDVALDAGFILPEGAAELRRRAPHAAEILEGSDTLLTVPRL